MEQMDWRLPFVFLLVLIAGGRASDTDRTMPGRDLAALHKQQSILTDGRGAQDPPRPVTPPQFTSVVVIGFTFETLLPFLQDDLLSASSLPMGVRHWVALYQAKCKAGIHSSPPSAELGKFLGSKYGDVKWSYHAGQYYYNAVSQKIRIDSTIPGGFLSTYSYYVFGNEWMFNFQNTANDTCNKYPLNKGSFPDVTWLQSAQYVGPKTILGIDTYHWQGKGNHLGPNLGTNVYDYYVSANDSTPILISNTDFVMYFMTFETVNTTQAQVWWNYPSSCGI